MDDFVQEVVNVYSQLYKTGKVQHFVLDEVEQIIACSGALLKRTYRIHFTQSAVMDSLEIKTVRLLSSKDGQFLYESLGFENTDAMVLHLK